MQVWTLVSLAAMAGFIVLAHRSEGGETLGIRQAFYLAAFCAFLFAGYNLYQWRSVQTAPAEVEAYVALYPNSQLRTRVPVQQLRTIRGLFSSEEVSDTLQGQWIFETEDSTDEVGKYYRQWSLQSPDRARVQVNQEFSEMMIDAPNHAMSVLAENHWGKTRITYTLMKPLD